MSGGRGGLPRQIRRAFRLPPRARDDSRAAVVEELELHIELAAQELVEQGASPEEARNVARRDFGDLEFTEEYCSKLSAQRDWQVRRLMKFTEIWQDLTFALRTLNKSRGFSGIVIITLALGIAANATVFSILNPYFVRALPYGDADELVQLGQVDPVSGWIWTRFSLQQLEDWEQRSRAFQGVGHYYYTIRNLTGPEGPEQQTVGVQSANMFDVLQSPALLGRTFAEGEDGPAGADVTVISFSLWQRRYGGDPGILGRTLTLDGIQHTVVGVMPREFNFPFGEVLLWIPDHTDITREARNQNNHIPIARLNPGFTVESARQELLTIQGDLSRIYPDHDGRYEGVTIRPIREALNFAWEALLILSVVLLGAVGFVLLIACVNVASLTLARATSRSREVAVRAAIGATRGRLVRQLLTESLLLSLVGGVLGVGLAYMAVAAIAPMIPAGLYRIGDSTIDGTVLAITLGVTLVTPLIFGLAPALSVTRVNLSDPLREGSQGSGAAPSAMRARKLLVIAEVAMAITLITGTGLMLRSFQQLQRLDLGFESDQTLVVEVTPPRSDYPGAPELTAYYNRAKAELEALPGVDRVGMVAQLPLNHETNSAQFARPDQLPSDPQDWPIAISGRVSPDYFDALRIPLLAGRAFDSSDESANSLSVVISQVLADRLWPEQSALGQTLLANDARDPDTYTVVGVVGDIHHDGLTGPVMAQLYLPMVQSARRRRHLTLSVAGSPASAVAAVRETLLRIDPNLPLKIRPMDSVVAESAIIWSVSSVMLGIFGLVALLLATLGIYGVISYSVQQRRKEIGLRMALGASARQVRARVLGDGLRLTGLGLLVGLGLALGLGKLLAAVLFGVSSYDPITLSSVFTLFVAVAVFASLAPAVKASRVAPHVALRQD